ncbi:MAG: SPOR domain-containing protein [Spirochaetota bacterium]|nr:SPOR domain-containing protein [Spirochaetota bacterium]
MVYKIQLGAFTNLELALKRKKRYEAMGLKSVIVLFKGEGKIFRLISKKSYSTEDSARLASSRMKDKGLSAFIFRF